MPHVTQLVNVVAVKGRAADFGVAASVWPIIPGAVYAVSCNGNAKGHECSERAAISIEDGDTWSSVETAVEFALGHVEEHEGREE